jgi:hypothetical protein
MAAGQDSQRMPIRLGAARIGGGQSATRSGARLNHELRAELLRQSISDDAGYDIGIAACAKAMDDRDGTFRPSSAGDMGCANRASKACDKRAARQMQSH